MRPVIQTNNLEREFPVYWTNSCAILGSLTMVTRRFLPRILLLALLLAPSGLPAFSRSLSASSCHLHSSIRTGTAGRSTLRSAKRFAASARSRHSQAQRMHRFRGKRLSAETPNIYASALKAVGSLKSLKLAAAAQELTGPNPSRGPPSLLSL